LCSTKHKHPETIDVIKEWIDKDILVPNNVSCCILGKDTTKYKCTCLLESKYKILLYVDSTGCSDCRLKLFLWKQLIEETDSLFSDKLSFLFFLQPKNDEDLFYLIRGNDFNYPVFIDRKNEINQLNNFPQQQEYQCFLLDKNNKVLFLGNPAINPNIWELYKRYILDKDKFE
jgi:hypothetical protein